jgi:hypothetical protein
LAIGYEGITSFTFHQGRFAGVVNGTDLNSIQRYLLGSARVGSNPAGVEAFCQSRWSLHQVNLCPFSPFCAASHSLLLLLSYNISWPNAFSCLLPGLDCVSVVVTFRASPHAVVLGIHALVTLLMAVKSSTYELVGHEDDQVKWPGSYSADVENAIPRKVNLLQANTTIRNTIESPLSIFPCIHIYPAKQSTTMVKIPRMISTPMSTMTIVSKCSP